MQAEDHNKNPLEIAIQWADEGRKVAVATVVSTWGSSSRPVGSQLVVDSHGVFEGSVSGGCVEPAVITESVEVISKDRGISGEYGFQTVPYREDDCSWKVIVPVMHCHGS